MATTKELKVSTKEKEILDKRKYKKPIDILLESEVKRIGRKNPFTEPNINALNAGHWELWQEDLDNEIYSEIIQLDNDFYIRDPMEDLKEQSIVGIDFGTSATVVVVSNSNKERRQLSIDASANVQENKNRKYENPTIMYFKDLDSFLEAYNERKSLPYTLWSDVSVASTAQEKYSEGNNKEAQYAFLKELKQWAGNKNQKIKYKPELNSDKELPPYIDIDKNDYDPIELYAYYLGLNINNLSKKEIYLNYYLSFPVTFNEDIRKQISESFKKGLRKSIPETIFNKGKSIIINRNISEPLAYASCVLQKYKIKPPVGGCVKYAVFDFGGGTSDFNYGFWRKFEGGRAKNYTIENVSASGVRTLGGENLLSELAYEIYKDNAEYIKKNEFCFQKPSFVRKTFRDEEEYISNSRFADINMRHLIKELREYWQTPHYYYMYFLTKLRDSPDESFRTTKLTKEKYLSFLSSEIAYYADQQGYEEKVVELKKCFDDLTEGIVDEQDCKIRILELFEDEITKVSSSGKIIIENLILYKEATGDQSTNHSVETTYERIFSFLEKKISKGIGNFFYALEKIDNENYKFSKEGDNTIKIFLAGNSCRSPIVSLMFGEQMAESCKRIEQSYEITPNYELFYPLGTQESIDYMKKNDIEYDIENSEIPTGKTGVAFGLIDCSSRGMVSIKNENENGAFKSVFNYYLGWEDEDGLFDPCVLINAKDKTEEVGFPKQDVWYKLNPAESPQLMIYAISNPECMSGKLKVEGNLDKPILLTLDNVKDGYSVFIKVKDADNLFYVVAKDDEVEFDDKNNFTRLDLSIIGD